jgi:hypothetical protein
MSHDLLIHAVVDKTERACILSGRSIDDRNNNDDDEEEEEEGEEEALNQLVISFRESHNSASYPLLHGIELCSDNAKKRREKSILLICVYLIPLFK